MCHQHPGSKAPQVVIETSSVDLMAIS